MKQVYDKIWELAKPYYKKGRPMDINHIEWMMKDAFLVCQEEHLDDSLLLPLVILHDVGYAEVPEDNPFKLNLRKAHMEAGAKIARHILEKLNYPEAQKEKIVYYVSVHDSWAIGNSKEFNKNHILGAFNDLDFIWMVTPVGFETVRTTIGKSPQEMLEYIEFDEKHKLRPFSTKITENLYKKYFENRKRRNFNRCSTLANNWSNEI